MTNKIASSLLALAVGGVILVGAAAAQTTTAPPAAAQTTPPKTSPTAGSTSGAGPGVVDPGHPRVNEVNRREENQQQAIGTEIKDGDIGSKRAAHLENEESSIQNQEKRDMAAHDGHLTKQEQQHLNNFENHVHNEIEDSNTGKAKSGSASGAGPGVVDPGHPRVNEVNRREENQQQAIGNEIKDGDIGSKRAAHLENEESSIQNQEKRDMAAHNGHLTKPEQQHLNKFENHVHNEIKTSRKRK